NTCGAEVLTPRARAATATSAPFHVEHCQRGRARLPARLHRALSTRLDRLAAARTATHAQRPDGSLQGVRQAGKASYRALVLEHGRSRKSAHDSVSVQRLAATALVRMQRCTSGSCST